MKNWITHLTAKRNFLAKGKYQKTKSGGDLQKDFFMSGACSVTVVVLGNGVNERSSNPGGVNILLSCFYLF